MSEFSVQAEGAQNQQQEKHVRLDDAREKLLPRREFERYTLIICEGQSGFRAVKTRDSLAIQTAQQFFRSCRDVIDQLAVEGFCFRKGFGLGDRSFCKLGVTPALF